ncbi:aldo/keto reductase [Gilvimarinus polysaccharolyticus]|uniref:aldo/keto reductase n=1 Tax=Gilvimarinus polysaccharolyticus TaxID=863921 RepID=UPI000673B2C3|nr:aldo/keto reductase [Gilvimarinus polysaccharolyticus]
MTDSTPVTSGYSFTQRPLGNTGISISALGLGTVKLGRNQGVKYPQGFQLPNDAEAQTLINRARELGINLIDTAPAYGISEQRLGSLLTAQRDDWVICSKVGEEFNDGVSHFDFSAAHTRSSIERSLKRLKTDHIDLVLVHSDGNDVDIIENTEVFSVLQQFKRDGKIRAFGMSSKTVAGGILAARESDCVMVTYNPAQIDEKPVLDECLRLGRGALLKKALASGHLCQTGGHSNPVRASLEFAFAHPGVSAAIIGTINPAHLDDNVHQARAALTALAGD